MRHDDADTPLVCVCDVAWPSPGWGAECATCRRPVIHMWGPEKQRRALAAYPQLASQRVNFSLRLGKPVPDSTRRVA